MQPGNIVVIIVGIICIWIGCLNRKGNLSMIHSYHYKRVSEEDRVPFGKQIGLGMMMIGGAMIFAGGLMIPADLYDVSALRIASTAVMIAGLVLGLFFAVRAMLKYNKGVF